jgi:hypothetical protein
MTRAGVPGRDDAAGDVAHDHRNHADHGVPPDADAFPDAHARTDEHVVLDDDTPHLRCSRRSSSRIEVVAVAVVDPGVAPDEDAASDPDSRTFREDLVRLFTVVPGPTRMSAPGTLAWKWT